MRSGQKAEMNDVNSVGIQGNQLRVGAKNSFPSDKLSALKQSTALENDCRECTGNITNHGAFANCFNDILSTDKHFIFL